MASSKIRLYGSTSGYVELEAPAVGDDGVLTLPTAAGGFGGVIAVKSVVKTDTFAASVTAGGAVDITGLSIAHAVSDAANKVLLTGYIGVSGEGGNQGMVGVSFAAGGTALNVGGADGSRTRVAASSGRIATNAASDGQSIQLLYTPGSTASVTYTMQAINVRNATAPIYVGRTGADSNDAGHPRGSCVFTLMEVSV